MRSSSRNYYTLVVREDDQYGEDDKWLVQFGDFNKEVVEDEMDDSYGDYKKKNLKIICTAESQEQIDTEVRNLNLAIESDKEAQRDELRGELEKAIKDYRKYDIRIGKLSKKISMNRYEKVTSLRSHNQSGRIFAEIREGIDKVIL